MAMRKISRRRPRSADDGELGHLRYAAEDGKEMYKNL